MPSSHRILVVEDDDLMRESVGRMLGKGDFAVNLAGDAEQARAVLEKEAIDLILLDWMLPGGETGIQFNEWLKQQPQVGWIPVVMMTSRSEDADVLLGFASGVDDYVKKPFSNSELLARIRAVLRRSSPVDDTGLIEVGDLKLNVQSRALFVRDEPVPLTPIGYGLLEFFLRSPERVHGRDELREAVWGADVHVAPRTIDVHIASLRQALRPWGYDQLLVTRHGSGYLFRLPEASSENPETESRS